MASVANHSALLNGNKHMHHFPKAELHVHLEGTATPSLIKNLSLAKGIELNPKIFSADLSRFIWDDFADFHNVFEEFFKTITSKDDYALMTYLYLAQLAQQNCVYAELIVAPFHAIQRDIPYEHMLQGLSDGIEKARAEFGIESRILMALMRHYGPTMAMHDIKRITEQCHPLVVGINLVGDITQYEIKAFEQVFDHARSKNLHLSCHAGEIDGGPKEMWQAINILGVERISHGVSCLEDSKLVETLIEKQITLEVCPSSNVILKMYPSYAEHPLRKLKDAGLLLTLNTDDPGFFNINLTHEYIVAQQYFNFSEQELLAATQQSIRAAFIEEPLKRKLLEKTNYKFTF
jgi:adenosine deaminase